MGMPTGHDRNADQIAYWNGINGQRWTDRQQDQDTMLAPVSDVLIDRAKVKTGERIVDVGCGCGATTIALAQRVGRTGHVFGIDISAPMLARARQVAAGGTAGRIRARGCDRAPVRAGQFRPSDISVRGDVLCRAGGFVRQYAPGAATVGPAGVRLLA
jgi:SAM-dependent methyltransferase